MFYFDIIDRPVSADINRFLRVACAIVGGLL